MKISRSILAAVIMLLGTVVWTNSADAQSAQQGQAQTMDTSITIMQPGQTGATTGGQAMEYPRSWYVPPVPPAAPNYPYYGGPYRWGKELVPEGNIYRFKKIWNIGELRRLNDRPGKLRVSETVYVQHGFSPVVEFEVNLPPNDVSWRRFNQCYELIAEISVDGVAQKSGKFAKDDENQIGDSQKIRGFVGTRACEIGGDLVLLYQQDGNFEQYGDSRYTSIGLSVGLMSGGSGAAQAGAIGFSRTTGVARIGYNTLPFGVYLVFKNTGKKYVPYVPPPAPITRLVPPPPSDNRGGKGIEDVSDNKLPHKKPSAELIYQEEDAGKKLPYRKPAPEYLQQQEKK